MNITDKDIAEYAESFTSEEPEIVKKLVQASGKDLEFTDMLSGRQVGMILNMLVKITGTKRVLEAGTFTGYSALMMAEALPDDGELITIEINRRYQRVSKPFFESESYAGKIKQIIGNALEIIPELTGIFGLIYLDADKINYPEYYRLAKQKAGQGTIIVLDNMLWGGSVLSAKEGKEMAIHKTSEIIRDDDEVEQVMLPLRDGVTIVRVK